MTRNVNFKLLLTNALLLGLCSSVSAASLELGHVRANRRGWTEPEQKHASIPTLEVETFAEEEEMVTEETFYAEAIEPEHEQSEVSQSEKATEEVNSSSNEKGSRIKRLRGIGRRPGGLILIGRGEGKKPTLRDGYLAVAAPPALRFSDLDPVNDRPPSPALPEFNFASSEYVPYLIETDLSEDELNNAAMLSEIVIEMAPHEVVSGQIETRRRVQDEMVEHFDLDEQRSTVLRPEEVLIYFETDTNVGKTGTMIPFSPATPNTTTIKSSATLTKE